MTTSPQMHLDGWASLLDGMEDATRDRLAGVYFRRGQTLGRTSIDALDRHNGVAATIIEAPADDATRAWVELRSQDEPMKDVHEAMRRLPCGEGRRGVRHAIHRALRLSRKYGGAGIVLGVQSTQAPNPDQPIEDTTRIDDVTFANVLNAHELIPRSYNRDPLSARYGEVEFYELRPEGSGSVNRLVHGSRVIRFDGVDLPHHQRVGRFGWGDSVLQRVFAALRNSNLVEDGVVRTLLATNLRVLRTKGLAEKVGTEKGEEQIKAKMKTLAYQMSMLGILLLDSEESLEWKAAALTGFDALLKSFPQFVAANARIPVTRLYGRSPAGLNATGQHDERNYYDLVKASLVEPYVVPAVEQIAGLMMRAVRGPTGGVVPDVWSVRALPLSQPTEKEQAETEKLHAEKDKLYIEAGVLTPEEVRASRYGADGWSADTRLDKDAKPSAGAGGQDGAGGEVDR